jgi:hypothetical protein
MHGAEQFNRKIRAFGLIAPRLPDLPAAGSKFSDTPQTRSDRDSPLATAFRSPIATFAYANPATGSTFPACCFASGFASPHARSVFRSTAHSGSPRLWAASPRQTRCAVTAETRRLRCQLSLPFGMFPSRGIAVAADSPPSSPPFETARFRSLPAAIIYC